MESIWINFDLKQAHLAKLAEWHEAIIGAIGHQEPALVGALHLCRHIVRQAGLQADKDTALISAPSMTHANCVQHRDAGRISAARHAYLDLDNHVLLLELPDARPEDRALRGKKEATLSVEGRNHQRAASA